MRLATQEPTFKVSAPISKKLYFTIWNRHPFVSRHDCCFCVICGHSLTIHIEYGASKRTKSFINKWEKRNPK